MLFRDFPDKASMRPEQFSSGNPEFVPITFEVLRCFNEAGAIQLRKSLINKASNAAYYVLQ